MFGQSLLHRNREPEHVHVIIKIEDSNLLDVNTLVRKSNKEALSVLQPRYQTLSQHQYQAFTNQLKSNLQDRRAGKSGVTSNVPEANELAYMVNALDICDEILPRRIQDEGYNVEYHLVPLNIHQHNANQHHNTNLEGIQHVLWLVDTDGLEFGMQQANGTQTPKLDVLNAARSTSVSPLRRFFNLQSLNIRTLTTPEAELYRNQHSRHFQSRGSESSAAYEHESGEWNSTGQRKLRRERNGTDHHVIFLHPNLEALKYDLSESSGLQVKNSIQDDSQPNNPIHCSATKPSLLFSSEAIEWPNHPGRMPITPFFSYRPNEPWPATRDFLGYKLAPKGVNLSASIKIGNFNHMFEQNNAHVRIRDFQRRTDPVFFQEAMNPERWNQSIMQSAVYMAKYGPNKAHFLIHESTSEILSNEAILRLLCVVKYTTRRLTDDEHECADRQVVWNRPHVCNGVTSIRISELDGEERERVESLYGNGYGGFKPCERRVRRGLRCAHHQQGGGRRYIDPQTDSSSE